MIRLRKGDTIVIMGYVHDRNECYSFVPGMDEFIGREATVRSCDEYGETVRLDIDGGRYVWHSSWLSRKKGRVDIY